MKQKQLIVFDFCSSCKACLSVQIVVIFSGFIFLQMLFTIVLDAILGPSFSLLATIVIAGLHLLFCAILSAFLAQFFGHFSVKNEFLVFNSASIVLPMILLTIHTVSMVFLGFEPEFNQLALLWKIFVCFTLVFGPNRSNSLQDFGFLNLFLTCLIVVFALSFSDVWLSVKPGGYLGNIFKKVYRFVVGKPRPFY